MTDAADLYRALLSSGRLSELRRLTYWCPARPSRCMLLDAVDTPLGIVVHVPRYKYSPMVNHRRSNPGMRARRTIDGNRHWAPSTYFLAGSPLGYDTAALPELPPPIVDFSCDHVLAHRMTRATFMADWSAGHAEVIVRRDGSRYSVH